jgi:hypothetical protein
MFVPKCHNVAFFSIRPPFAAESWIVFLKYLAPILHGFLDPKGSRSTHEHLFWFSRDQTVVLLSFSSLQIPVELDARFPFPEYNRGQGADIVLVHVGYI